MLSSRDVEGRAPFHDEVLVVELLAFVNHAWNDAFFHTFVECVVHLSLPDGLQESLLGRDRAFSVVHFSHLARVYFQTRRESMLYLVPHDVLLLVGARGRPKNKLLSAGDVLLKRGLRSLLGNDGGSLSGGTALPCGGFASCFGSEVSNRGQV